MVLGTRREPQVYELRRLGAANAANGQPVVRRRRTEGAESLLAWRLKKGTIELLKKVQTFLSEVRVEMQKVTWSTREELMGSTAVVLMTMLILSTFIGITDFVFSNVLSLFLR